MSGALMPGRSGRGNKQAELSPGEVNTLVDVSERLVAAVYQVSNHAQMWSLYTNMIQRRAEHMSPDNADSQARIAMAADITATSIINSMARKMG